MNANNSQIKSFFKNQTIFLTGGTGFLGKVMIEKLLREGENLKKLYILVRPKKGKKIEQRITELFEQPCFDLVKSQNGNFMEKVSFIGGDCQEPWLGISDDDLIILKNEVNCVIHLAANVRFDQSLKEAGYNVRTTRDLLELSRQIKDLKCFVFVSTAFSNCVSLENKEEISDLPIEPALLINMINGLSDNILAGITPKLLGKWPNTYVYTKCISEHLVKRAAKYFPTAVVRPAIIMNSAEEPLPGWIDNIYGPVGIVLGAGLGMVRCFRAKGDTTAYIVPVDYVCNCVLAATWKIAKENFSETTVFNYVGFNRNFLNWDKFYTIIWSNYWSTASKDLIWYNNFKIRGNKVWHDICTFLLHTVPAYFIDAVFYCLRKPPMAVKAYRKIDKVLTLTSYFTTRHWYFHDSNVQELWLEMNEDDKQLFCFTMQELQWKDYLRGCILGMRSYLTKDPPDVSPKTYVKLVLLMIANYTVFVMFWFLIYKLFTFILTFLW